MLGAWPPLIGQFTVAMILSYYHAAKTGYKVYRANYRCLHFSRKCLQKNSHEFPTPGVGTFGPGDPIFRLQYSTWESLLQMRHNTHHLYTNPTWNRLKKGKNRQNTDWMYGPGIRCMVLDIMQSWQNFHGISIEFPCVEVEESPKCLRAWLICVISSC